MTDLNQVLADIESNITYGSNIDLLADTLSDLAQSLPDGLAVTYSYSVEVGFGSSVGLEGTYTDVYTSDGV